MADAPDVPAVAAENARKIWHDDVEGDPLNEWRSNMRLAYELGFAHGAIFGVQDAVSATAPLSENNDPGSK